MGESKDIVEKDIIQGEPIYLEAQGALDDYCIENVSTPEPENTTGNNTWIT